MHGMIQWPFLLWVFGEIFIVLFGIRKTWKYTPVYICIGYLLGFFIGYLFQSDYGNGLNHLWILRMN